MTTNPSPTERASHAASTAADEGARLAGTAGDEVRNVASTAAEQARNLADETRQQITTQLGDQASTQRDRLVGTLRTLCDDLEQMAGQAGGSGLAADLVHEVADRARSLGDHLADREPGDLLEDARRFARRRPGTFLLGALAAGMVAGRVLRATADGVAGATAAQRSAAGTGGPGDPLSAPPTVSSGPGVVGGPTPTNPPMPSTMPGQPTMDAP
jgi:hypothetical protein